jgi:hypothetical protein
MHIVLVVNFMKITIEIDAVNNEELQKVIVWLQKAIDVPNVEAVVST